MFQTVIRRPLALPTAFWSLLSAEAEAVARAEPSMRRLMDEAILSHDGFEAALTGQLVARLSGGSLTPASLRALIEDALADDPGIAEAALADLKANRDRNPAYPDHVTPFLFFKGFQTVQWQRISHWLWLRERRPLATLIHSQTCDVFSIDIHPGAVLGRGLFVDHGTGIVIGETAVVGDDVSLLQEVTLGGTGRECGDRHPKIGRGVLIGAGAKVLGNIQIGEGAKIGAGSVVLRDVPAYVTVAGVPARIVGLPRADGENLPGLSMDQSLPDPDYSI